MKYSIVKIITLVAATVSLYGCASASPNSNVLNSTYWKEAYQTPNDWSYIFNNINDNNLYDDALFVALGISEDGIRSWAIVTQPRWIEMEKDGLICIHLTKENKVGMCDNFGSGGFFHDSNRRIEWEKVRNVARGFNLKFKEFHAKAKIETENNIKNKINSSQIKDFLSSYSTGSEFALLDVAIRYDNADMADYIYRNLDNPKRIDSALFQRYKNYAIKNNKYESLIYIGQQGDKEALRAAYSIATPDQKERLMPAYFAGLTDSELNEAYKNASPTDKVKVEKVVVPRFAQRLANIKYTVANANTQAYGGADTSLGSQLMALLGSKVGVSADTPVTYTVQLNPALLKVQGNYNFKAQIVLKATGKETSQTYCMWPLPKICDGENNSAVRTYTKNITGTLSGNTIHTGSASIEWKPKFADQSMSGLQTTFVTNDVSVSLVGFTIDPQN